MKLRRMLGSKLHMATVTEANLEYEGSITIDEDLLDAVGIVPYEFVLVSNLENGERFETYVIPGKRGSGNVCLNGATARKGKVGDKIFVFSFVYMTEDKLGSHKPRIAILTADNKAARLI